MMLEWLSDHRYVCPVLMFLQSVIKRQRWQYGCSGWTLMQSQHATASCVWPRWATSAECRFWNSTVGIKLRALIGSQQREYRIKLQNSRDAWQKTAESYAKSYDTKMRRKG